MKLGGWFASWQREEDCEKRSNVLLLLLLLKEAAGGRGRDRRV